MMPAEHIDNSKLVQQVADESGFRFHNVLRQSTETHQDCLCSLAMSIGHSETSYEKYGPVK